MSLDRWYRLKLKFLPQTFRATLQFCFLKPPMAIVTIILATQGHYSEGDWDPEQGKLELKSKHSFLPIFQATSTFVLFTIFLFRWLFML